MRRAAMFAVLLAGSGCVSGRVEVGQPVEQPVALAPIPEVVGLGWTDAQARLPGFTAEWREADCGAAEGQVCSTYPRAGEAPIDVVVVWVQVRVDVRVEVTERERRRADWYERDRERCDAEARAWAARQQARQQREQRAQWEQQAREAQERADRDARQQAERERQAAIDREARERADRDARDRAEWVRQIADLDARTRAERARSLLELHHLAPLALTTQPLFRELRLALARPP